MMPVERLAYSLVLRESVERDLNRSIGQRHSNKTDFSLPSRDDGGVEYRNVSKNTDVFPDSVQTDNVGFSSTFLQENILTKIT